MNNINNDDLDLPILQTEILISIKTGDTVRYCEWICNFPIVDFKHFTDYLLPYLNAYSNIQDNNILKWFEEEYNDFKLPKIDLE